MKKPRRFIVNEQTFGLRVEFYVNTAQSMALKRCAAVMEMDANDPENAPDDTAAAWAAPDALWRRVEVAQRLATLAGAPVDSRALAPRVLPGGVSRDTASALARADSGDTALALLLVSPEFLRR